MKTKLYVLLLILLAGCSDPAEINGKFPLLEGTEFTFSFGESVSEYIPIKEGELKSFSPIGRIEMGDFEILIGHNAENEFLEWAEVFAWVYTENQIQDRLMISTGESGVNMVTTITGNKLVRQTEWFTPEMEEPELKEESWEVSKKGFSLN